MSLQALEWAFRQRVKVEAGDRLLLVSMAYLADDHGLCRASRHTMGSTAGVKATDLRFSRLARVGLIKAAPSAWQLQMEAGGDG